LQEDGARLRTGDGFGTRNRIAVWLAVVAGTVAQLPAVEPPGASARVVDLKCEYAVAPCGIDVAAPRLGWRIDGDARGTRQVAWQVLVASAPELLAQDRGDLWDSGRVASDETAHLAYAGAPLASSATVWWKARAWVVSGADAAGSAGSPTAWSEPATWTMACWRWRTGRPLDLRAWISEALLLRKNSSCAPACGGRCCTSPAWLV